MKCDVFVFGLVLSEILVGKPVFGGAESHFRAIDRIGSRDLPGRTDKHRHLMKTSMGDRWKRNPQDRPSFAEVFVMFVAADLKTLPRAGVGIMWDGTV
jgi:hypothetical protein